MPERFSNEKLDSAWEAVEEVMLSKVALLVRDDLAKHGVEPSTHPDLAASFMEDHGREMTGEELFEDIVNEVTNSVRVVRMIKDTMKRTPSAYVGKVTEYFAGIAVGMGLTKPEPEPNHEYNGYWHIKHQLAAETFELFLAELDVDHEQVISKAGQMSEQRGGLGE